MIRYILYLVIYLVMLLAAVVVTPLLPLFSVLRIGGINNDDHQGMGFRLPLWLSWFDTKDNALTGDEAFLERHPKGTYLDMVLWLYRNPLYGFKWDVLGAPVINNGDIIFIKDNTYVMDGYFQTQWKGKKFGWILDAYYKRLNLEPKAIFVFWM